MRKKVSHKLTIDQRKRIWKLFNEGFSPTDIAKEFSVSRLTIYTIGKDPKYKN
jgi:DNA invertase Pin-like site-specific DNA recombinase